MKCRVWSVNCGVWSVEFEVWIRYSVGFYGCVIGGH